MKNGIRICKPTSITYSGTSASNSGQGSIEFSSVNELILNGVFTSLYDNYMIVCRLQHSSASSITSRLALGGVTNSTSSSYSFQSLQANGTTVSASRTTPVSNVRWDISYSSGTQRAGFTMYVYGPSIAQPTAFRSVTISDTSDGEIIDYAGTHNQSVQYDGIRFYFGGVTGGTGLISVYGLVD